ncbi:GAF domain-containing protein [Fulvimarina endophytica]|nr:GAF domain-containing protein [Fulvimarina endophytica]
MIERNWLQRRSDRIEALRRSGLLEGSSENAFGSFTDHVREVLDVPVAIVTLVDENRQVFAGHSGLPSPWDERGETPMTHSFCQYVVDRGAPLSVPDARQDDVLKTNHAIGDIGVIAYLGVPLTLPDGAVIGALAAISDSRRIWTDADERRLLVIARTVEREMAVRISESRWRSIFEQLAEGFILARVLRDESGRVVDWMYEEVNSAWHQLVGVEPGMVVGRTVREVFPGIEDEWVMEFADVVETGEPIRFTRQVGSLGRWYDGAAQPIGGDRFTVIFLEVTGRIEQERRQTALLTLGDDLRDLTSVNEIVEAASRAIAKGVVADRIGFGTVDDRNETIDISSDWCARGMVSVTGRHSFRSFGSFVDDLKQGRTVAIDDVNTDPRTATTAEAFTEIQTRSLLNLPIVEAQRLVLIVYAHGMQPHAWTEEELRFVQQVGDSTQAAIGRLRAEDGRRLLNQELAHRLKNSLAMVQAIATQTLRQAQSMEEGRDAISARLGALARAQDILTGTDFVEADIIEVVGAALAPHLTPSRRIDFGGPHGSLTAQQALGISLAIHELATNATKYGALSNETGRVCVTWGEEAERFVFRWIEADGPPVHPPERRGFGSKLIERIVASYFEGEGRIDFDPAGIRFQLTGAFGHKMPDKPA